MDNFENKWKTLRNTKAPPTILEPSKYRMRFLYGAKMYFIYFNDD